MSIKSPSEKKSLSEAPHSPAQERRTDVQDFEGQRLPTTANVTPASFEEEVQAFDAEIIDVESPRVVLEKPRKSRTSRTKNTKKSSDKSSESASSRANRDGSDEKESADDTEQDSPDQQSDVLSGDGFPEDVDVIVEGALGDRDSDTDADAEVQSEVEVDEDAVPQSTTALARLDPLQAYLREVQRHPLLTPEQEHLLATRYFKTQDVRAAHALVTANLRLVVKIAYEYRRAYKAIMDLVQEGNVGLMQAVKKYDPSRGVKLSSYAAWWIRAYILRYVLNNWRMVKIGTTQAQRKLFFNLNKEKQRLTALGIEPTHQRIADELHVDPKEVAEMDVRLGSSESSLDAPVGDADGKAIARVDLMPAQLESADVMLAEAELRNTLRGKLEAFRQTLKGKDLEIFDLRLVPPDEPLTLQELGERFGVSRERVRQLEARLVGKLRIHLKDELEEHAQSAL